MTDTPNVGLPLVPEGTLDPAAGLNLALIVADALIQTSVIAMDLTAPPGSPADGDMYIVDTPATGDWAGQENNLARYVAEGTFWQFYEAGTQVKLIVNQDNGGLYRFVEGSPGNWLLIVGLGDAPSDGGIYGRRDAAWAEVNLTLADEDSPPTEVLRVTDIVIAEGLELTEDTSGVARLALNQGIPYVWTGVHVFGAAGTAVTITNDLLVGSLNSIAVSDFARKSQANVFLQNQSVADNSELQLGTDNDLRLFHDGTNSTLRNDTGVMQFMAGASIEASYDASGWTFNDTPTVPNASWNNSKLADMAQSTIKGRAAGAGTGVPTDLTPTQSNQILAGLSGTYTPVWKQYSATTDPTIGDGTITGSWAIAAGVMQVSIKLTIGSTTTLGDGLWTFSSPTVTGISYSLAGVYGSALAVVGGSFQAYIGVARGNTIFGGGQAFFVGFDNGNAAAAVPDAWVTANTLEFFVVIPIVYL